MSKKGMKWSRQGDAVDFCCKDKAKKNKKQKTMLFKVRCKILSFDHWLLRNIVW